MLCMILAADENGGIGYKNGLPWPKVSEDLKFFKRTTEDQVVVMGSNTWKSLGGLAPLKGRTNYVLSSSNDHNKFPGCQDVYDYTSYGIEQILESIQYRHKFQDVFIIGGKTLYDAAHEFCDTVYLTRILGKYKCDTICDIDKYLNGADITDVYTIKGDRHTPSIRIETYEKDTIPF